MLYWLADPAISDRDFEELRDVLSSSQVRELLEQATLVRNAFVNSSFPPSIVEHRSRSANKTVADRIDHLLRQEARLSATEAITRLEERLGIPPVSKNRRSFRQEIERLEIRHGGQLLLSLAQQIYNESVHRESGISDWPLRDQQ
jgi:hypothetical protein